MRNMGKLCLMAVGWILTMALAPSATWGQGVELEREQGGDCPASVGLVSHVPTERWCGIHAISEPGTTAALYQHALTGEALFSQCTNEFEAAFNRNGHGYVYHQTLSPEGGSCNREPCDESGAGAHPHRNLEWEARVGEPGSGSAEREVIRATFCLYPHNPTGASEGSQGSQCTVDLNVHRVGHAYEVRTLPMDLPTNQHGSPCINLGGAVEVVGHWITTPSTPQHQGFEIHHLDDQAG